MQGLWTRDFLTRRIDRCYLVASWARAAERRARHLALARYYRTMLMRMAPAASPAWSGHEMERGPASLVPQVGFTCDISGAW